jgi:anti-sigma regulatory factor (Ser/Thr protein kinase)
MTVSDESPRHLRRIARAYMHLWALPQLTDSVVLVLTELVTNVYRHVPDRWCTITLSRSEVSVRLVVYDRSPVAPRHSAVSELLEGGRGLTLVAQLVDKWEVAPETVGKSVWCEISCQSAD